MSALPHKKLLYAYMSCVVTTFVSRGLSTKRRRHGALKRMKAETYGVWKTILWNRKTRCAWASMARTSDLCKYSTTSRDGAPSTINNQWRRCPQKKNPNPRKKNHGYRGGATITKYLASIQARARQSTIHERLSRSKIIYMKKPSKRPLKIGVIGF